MQNSRSIISIEKIATTIGVLGSILYCCGFVAERSFWNTIGVSPLSVNHLDYLYRGGTFAITCIVETLLLPTKFFAYDWPTGSLLALTFFAIVTAIFCRSVRNRIGNFYVIFSSLVAGVFTFAISLRLMFAWPTEGNLILNPSMDKNSLDFGFCVVVWALLFVYAIQSRIVVFGRADKTVPKNIWLLRAAKSFHYNSILSCLLLGIFLPALYGSIGLPTSFPKGKVAFSKDVPAQLKLLEKSDLVFLDYSATQRQCLLLSDEPRLVQLRNADILAINIDSNFDLRMLPSYSSSEPIFRVPNTAKNNAMFSWLKEVASMRNEEIKLLAPDGQLENGSPLLFQWEYESDCKKFVWKIVRIDEDEEENTLFEKQLDGTVRSVKQDVTNSLKPENEYFWRVTGLDDENAEIASGETRIFVSSMEERKNRLDSNQLFEDTVATYPYPKHLDVIKALAKIGDQKLSNARLLLLSAMTKANANNDNYLGVLHDFEPWLANIRIKRNQLAKRLESDLSIEEAQLLELLRLSSILLEFEYCIDLVESNRDFFPQELSGTSVWEKNLSTLRFLSKKRDDILAPIEAN